MNKLKKNKKYWADTFADCIVDKRERNAPPERYFAASKGYHNIYIDTFILRNGTYINFAWDESQKTYWQDLLIAHFEYHNADWRTARLIQRVYPPKVFEELVSDGEAYNND